ncbi:hypothetical protein KIN20_011621 [Parelaphostrongylus tenuis]|uniref:Uncharacterized protein n=1 Tax=Parelaphostrongylus tenuis TaxID=148309 RepID=A0AAD5N0F4_PARTN|nr:hypothetical protein KIN20_011621 [Parelaphostrongylus tenuis]
MPEADHMSCCLSAAPNQNPISSIKFENDDGNQQKGPTIVTNVNVVGYRTLTEDTTSAKDTMSPSALLSPGQLTLLNSQTKRLQKVHASSNSGAVLAFIDQKLVEEFDQQVTEQVKLRLNKFGAETLKEH